MCICIKNISRNQRSLLQSSNIREILEVSWAIVHGANKVANFQSSLFQKALRGLEEV